MPEESDGGERARARGDRPERTVGDGEWPVVESAVEYETGWYDGGYDLVEQPNGTEKHYYWADLPPAVVVVALAEGPAVVDEGDPDGTDRARAPNRPGGRVVFVEQYRPVIRQTQMELPAGIVEEGESYTEAGLRELEEETGFAAESASLLQRYWVSTGAMRHERGIVFAEGLTPTEQRLDENEFLTVRPVPVEEAVDVARTPPTNGATIDGLLLARDERLL
jgi:ADP-ribose pyrophosphatase